MPNNLARYKQMMGDLQAQRDPAMSPSVQDAIIQAESSGKSDAIGDIGAIAGESRGLMQIQDQTARDLLKQGKLPKVWNGKKVKKKDLPELLMDPEFNKQAGSALYEDNKKILQRKAKQKNIQLDESQLEDLAIKSHNQGVTRTIKRDLLGEEPLNPKVQKYLQKIKPKQTLEDGGMARRVDPEVLQMIANKAEVGGDVILPEPEGDDFSYLERQLMEDKLRKQEILAGQPQEFQEGGVVDDYGFETPEFEQPEFEQPAPMEAPIVAPASASPIEQAKETEYEKLMKEYDKAKKKHEGERERAQFADLASGVVNAFAQYGVDKAAAKAQIAGDTQLQRRDLGLKNLTLASNLKAPQLSDYVAKTKMMKELAGLKGKTGASTDPKSKASQTSRDQAAFLTGREFPESFTEAQISKMISPLARKIESGYQKKRLVQSDKRIGISEEKKELSKENLALSKQKHGYKVSEDDEADAYKYQQMANQHPAYKFAQGVKNDIQSARDVLKGAVSGEATALKTLGVKLAKAFGEKGALSESDVTRYIQDASILGWIRSKGSEYKDAKITPAVQSSITNILNDMEKNAGKRLNVAYLDSAKRFSRSRKGANPLSLKKALYLVNPDYSPVDTDKLANQALMKKPSEEQINKYIKMNPQINREQAVRIMTQRLNR